MPRRREVPKRRIIPDPKFKANFGRQHSFKVNRVINQTTVVAGQTQFIYGGYTFVILDPWPAEWLFTDDVYIDYVDDDYFGHSGAAPGMNGELRVYPQSRYVVVVLSNLEPPAAMRLAAFTGHRLPL